MESCILFHHGPLEYSFRKVVVVCMKVVVQLRRYCPTLGSNIVVVVVDSKSCCCSTMAVHKAAAAVGYSLSSYFFRLLIGEELRVNGIFRREKI